MGESLWLGRLYESICTQLHFLKGPIKKQMDHSPLHFQNDEWYIVKMQTTSGESYKIQNTESYKIWLIYK